MEGRCACQFPKKFAQLGGTDPPSALLLEEGSLWRLGKRGREGAWARGAASTHGLRNKDHRQHTLKTAHSMEVDTNVSTQMIDRYSEVCKFTMPHLHTSSVSVYSKHEQKSDCSRRDKRAGHVHVQQSRERGLLTGLWLDIWSAEAAPRRKDALRPQNVLQASCGLFVAARPPCLFVCLLLPHHCPPNPFGMYTRGCNSLFPRSAAAEFLVSKQLFSRLLKNHTAKILYWEHIKEPLPWDSAILFCVFCRHTANAPITWGTHTGGVQ